MLNAKLIKEQLNTDNIISIVESLGGELRSGSNGPLIFTSICHNIDAGDPSHKPKLYYYPQSEKFKCFVCEFSGDIFSLIQERWGLLDQEDDFIDVLNYVIDVCDLDVDKASIKSKKEKFDWGFLDKIVRLKNDEQSIVEPKVYDDKILEFFSKIYHTSFLNDNISIETMNKYGLKFYPFRQQTIIPVYNEYNQFVGIHCRNHIQEIVDIGLKYQPCRLLDGTEYKFPTSAVLYGLAQNKENIIETKTVRLFEAPKSVLQMEEILERNNSVGLFGTNLSKYKRDILLKLGVINWEICLDKQYKKWYNKDDGSDDYKEFDKWVKQVNKIIKMLQGYGNISVVCDRGNLMRYKDSPSDNNKEIWGKLLENEIKIE